jgi:hypothetical protein
MVRSVGVIFRFNLLIGHRDSGMSTAPSTNGPFSPVPGAALPRDYSGQGPVDSAFVPNANDHPSMAIG